MTPAQRALTRRTDATIIAAFCILILSMVPLTIAVDPHPVHPARSTPPALAAHVTADAPSQSHNACAEDSWCWSALVNGNHRGTYNP